MPRMLSYSSESSGILGFFREAASLYAYQKNGIHDIVRTRIQDARDLESCVRERTGIDLENLDVLEIGPGHFLGQITYFACRNRCIGIDRDVSVEGLRLGPYLEMLRINGMKRTIKTLGRKLSGIDRSYTTELKSQLGIKKLPAFTLLQMDACKLDFPSESFDFVYSRSVFQHLIDPSAAIDEIVRVLRPGGVAHVSLHLYTSESGSLDPRLLTDRRAEIPPWAHLRHSAQPELQKANNYLNKLRLGDWRKLFRGRMPAVEFILTPSTTSQPEVARALQAKGELLEYSLEELLTSRFAVLWRKA